MPELKPRIIPIDNTTPKPIKWSASRVGTFCDCKLKYKYNYIDKWRSSDTAGNEFAEKGLCFHETAELYQTGMTDEECYNILDSKIKEHNVDVNKYPEKMAVDRFLAFWKKFVAPKELTGYEVKKESWTNGVIDNNNFCGALDLLLERPDSVIIYDYKTCTTIAASKYKNQQVLYAYLKGQEHGWTNEEIVKNVKLNIFFPFGKVNETLPLDMQANSCTKELKYTVADIEAVINDHFIKHINESKQTDWSTITPSDGVVSFGCNFCQYAGGLPDPRTGFPGCMSSFNQGYLQKRGVTFTKED